jgi:hypothetical protein
MTAIDGHTLEGVSTTLWTLHNRGTEAKRSDDAVALIRDCAVRLPGGRMMSDPIPKTFTRRTLTGFRLSDRHLTSPMPFGLSVDDALAFAGAIPRVRAARDVALPPGRGLCRLAGWKPLDHIGFVRRNRPSMTLLEFA